MGWLSWSMDFFTLLSQPSRAKPFHPSRPVSHEILAKLTWAAERAPTTDDAAGCHVELIRTEAGKRRLGQANAAVGSLAEAAVLLVFCAQAPAGDFADTSVPDPRATVDAAAAAFSARLAAIALGLAVDWVAVHDPVVVAQALDLQAKFTPVVILGVGYER